MTKFYVTSGNKSLTLTAPSAEFAAMRLIDEVMSQHVWIYSDSALSEQDRHDHITLEALLNLASSVNVSQRGIGRCEEGSFEVPELISDWHRLMTGLVRLKRSVVEAD